MSVKPNNAIDVGGVLWVNFAINNLMQIGSIEGRRPVTPIKLIPFKNRVNEN